MCPLSYKIFQKWQSDHKVGDVSFLQNGEFLPQNITLPKSYGFALMDLVLVYGDDIYRYLKYL
jgi:hypothetical protein